MAEERIQKVLSDQGVCSRRAAEQMIADGRVKVNGHPVKLGDKMDPDFDKASIDGKNVRIVRKRQYLYLMLNKPRGYITTAADELGRKTVMDLLTGVNERVYPVGRLDRESEGLLLLTNDGEFANLMTHPSAGIGKLYRVSVRPRATEAQMVQLSSGVTLDDGTKTSPAVIHVAVDEPGRTVLEITLHEGKNREIRRMCEAVGLEVIRLKRSAEGSVKLGMLQPGEWRELKKVEVNALRAAALKHSHQDTAEDAGRNVQSSRKAKNTPPHRRAGPLKT
jgi:23S rRNA pseudouridine2605 synthase